MMNTWKDAQAWVTDADACMLAHKGHTFKEDEKSWLRYAKEKTT